MGDDEFRSLGDVAIITMGQSPKGDSYNDTGEGTPLLNGPTEFGNHHPTSTKWTTEPTRFCHKGDILFCVRGSTTGRMNWADKEYCIGRGVASFRAENSDVDTRFIYFSLVENLPKLLSLTSGSVFPNLSKKDFNNFEIYWPEKKIRQKIAHILGTMDNKIELNRCMNHTLEAIARAIFKSWFVDFNPVRAKLDGRNTGLPPEIDALFPDGFEDSEVGKIPRGWVAGKLGDVIEIHDSKRIPLSKRERAKRPGKYPYYGAASIMDYIDDYIFHGIYVLVGEDGSVIDDDGYPVIQYVWGKFWANNHAHVLQGKNGISTEHVMLSLMHTVISPYVTGAVQPKLNQRNLKVIPFVIPQKEVSKVFNNLISGLYSKYRVNGEEQKTLAELRDTLLPKLMRGELRV
jgi:type I restriction enzyme S subunit